MAPPPTPPPNPPPQPDPGADRPADRGARQPALKRTVVRPAAARPDPVDAAFVATRLTTLTHELSGLLDGSLRVISLARRSIAAPDARTAPHTPPTLDSLSRQLDAVHAAMRQMAELVRTSMIGFTDSDARAPRDGFGAGSSLADAVRHAVDVAAASADDLRVELDVQIAPELAAVPAGPVYAVVFNAVRNAVESIQRVASRQGADAPAGRVLVSAWAEPGKTGRCVMLEVADDGEGPPPHPSPRRPADTDDRVFALGFSTKPGGSGVGLALARDVVESLGGTITLARRPRDPHTGRSGAILHVCYPIATPAAA